MPIQSQQDAEQQVARYLQRHYPELLDSTIATMTILTERTIALATGWVIEYDLTYQDDGMRPIGSNRYYVEQQTGTITSFSIVPNALTQEAIYQAIHAPQPQLPWPVLQVVTVAGTHHLTVNVLPHLTICNAFIPESVPQSLSEVQPGTRQWCHVCEAYCGRIGNWCYRCGLYLLPATDHHCSLPEPEYLPYDSPDSFWRE